LKNELVFVETNSTGHGIRAIGTAKRMGYSVTFLTSDPGFYRDGDEDPLSEVDWLVVTDTYDVDSMLERIDRNATRGIVAFDDYHLLPAGEMAARLGLPHPNLEGLRNARFKDRTRLRMAELGERRPRFAVLSGNEGTGDSPIGYPCVVKPVDDSGSVGVRVCEDGEEYRRALGLLGQRTRNVRGYRLEKRWLVEEYVEGPEYSAEVLWVDDDWRVLGVTRKLVTSPPYCVELGHVFPALPEGMNGRHLEERVLSWVRALGMRWGAAHVEFKVSDEGPVLMEVNPRLGGDLIPELCGLACGFDVVEYFLRISAGESPPLEAGSLEPKKAYAIQFLCADRSGVVERINGIQELNLARGVVDWRAAHLPAKVRGLTSSYDRLGYVITEGEDAAEAECLAEEAIGKLALVWGVERGVDLSYR
jgi:biotin carboxylase